MEKILIITDVHLMSSNKKEEAAYSLVKKVAIAEKFNTVINLGDMLDLEAISKFVEGLPGMTENARLSDELDLLEKELIFWRKVTKRSILLEGNHDYRLDNELNKHPIFKGTVPRIIDVCEDTGTAFIPLIEQPKPVIDSIPDVLFAHGLSAGETAPSINMKRAGTTIVTGHAHKTSSFGWGYPTGQVAIGYSLGTLGSINPAYSAGKRLTGATQSFGILYVEGNQWQMNVIMINDGKCIVNGKLYALEKED